MTATVGPDANSDRTPRLIAVGVAVMAVVLGLSAVPTNSAAAVTPPVPAEAAGIAVAVGSMTGHVKGNGAPLVDVHVTAWSIGGNALGGEDYTGVGGEYTIPGLADGEYRVSFSSQEPGFVNEYYNNTTNESAATPVRVSAGITTARIDADLAPEGLITGRVTVDDHAPLAEVIVSADPIGHHGPGATGFTDGDGAYTIIGLAAGKYRVGYHAPPGSGLIGEYYNDTPSDWAATPLTVTAGQTVKDIDAVLTVAGPPPSRPAAPRSVSAVPGNGSAALKWTAPPDGGSAITDYVIQRSFNGTSGWTTINDGVRPTTAYTVTGLTNGTRYYFRVTAHNSRGNSVASSIVNTIPRTKPGAPRGVRATPLSRSARLTWTAPATGGSAITDYLIHRSPNGRTRWTTINDGVRPTTAYTVTGLTNGTRYYFRVTARNAAGNGLASGIVNTIPRTTPGAPRRVQATPLSRSVKLTWRAPATGGSPITDYVIQRSTNGRSWKTVADGVSTVRSYTVTRLTSGVTYRLRVAARNAAGRGVFSTAVTGRPN